MPDIQEFLNQGLPNRVRNNHALEHATLHVLQEKGIAGRFGGISDAGGFWIYGETDTETLLLAAQEALKRLADGESDTGSSPQLRHKSGRGVFGSRSDGLDRDAGDAR